ncbi:DegT/DnrJ/EryC1/StrS aminotransferase family protein [Bacteriovorax sp. Seq25_V]|uniref:DegT/DnrJ/EryC1/StrS family aminotransferase n=1 Tax=Bacteriovorax sp. Seq25_V TaxID=1201288 RepID=UPI00038A1A3B|nr:aminotransferase class V-fold PLP-dependent enzyme [Bacteriovorax sp. Seq25_V]EQC46885.1 DegT/DnrJ/EryC1/StrS aminotransferase family protein [Bacteriovorax sp. Seq25_V]
MRIKFQDLRILNNELRFELIENLRDSFDDGVYINGKAVSEFEFSIRELFDIKDAIYTNSGTSALLLALKELGVGVGDEVILPAMSWVATAHVIAKLGALPVFCDVNQDLVIDVLSFKKMITAKTKAVIPVHFGGVACEMEGVLQVAKKHGIKVIEDCAQAFGNKYQKYKLGTLGDYGCFSLNPMKIMGALGEAGLIITNHKNAIRDHLYSGVNSNKEVISTGANYRGDNLQARFLNTMLKYQDEKSAKVLKIWNLYKKYLPSEVTLVGRDHDFTPYCVNILSSKRNEIELALNQSDVETKRLHVPIMPDISVYQSCKRDTKYIDEVKNKLCTLPLHQYLEEEHIIEICQVINRVVK